MKKSAYTMFAALVVVCAGCQNTVDTLENEQKEMKVNYIRSKNISTDGYLRDRLIIDSMNKATLPGGIMQAQVTIRSNRVGFFTELWSDITDEDPYKIAYRFNWLDLDGMEIQTANSVWTELDLIPGETRRLQSVAPNPRCKDFMLSIKEFDYK
ncbi:MAG: YcfL family protein [Victivallales bacterium]|nr:YcfL family protein [Victivallales bacterium]